MYYSNTNCNNEMLGYFIEGCRRQIAISFSWFFFETLCYATLFALVNNYRTHTLPKMFNKTTLATFGLFMFDALYRNSIAPSVLFLLQHIIAMQIVYSIFTNGWWIKDKFNLDKTYNQLAEEKLTFVDVVKKQFYKWRYIKKKSP